MEAPVPYAPYDYYELIRVVEALSDKIDGIQETLTPILWCIVFYMFIRIGFTCMRSYKA